MPPPRALASRHRPSRCSDELPTHHTRVDSDSFFLHNGGIKEDGLATLNVKDFPDALYRRLKARARRERRSVAQEVILLLERAVEPDDPLSILELRGLGKEIWKDLDAVDHVDRERNAWD